jgi:hypothetical protein
MFLHGTSKNNNLKKKNKNTIMNIKNAPQKRNRKPRKALCCISFENASLP